MSRGTPASLDEKRSVAPSVSPIATGRTPSSASVLAVNGLSAAIRVGAAALAAGAAASARRGHEGEESGAHQGAFV